MQLTIFAIEPVSAVWNVSYSHIFMLKTVSDIGLIKSADDARDSDGTTMGPYAHSDCEFSFPGAL